MMRELFMQVTFKKVSSVVHSLKPMVKIFRGRKVYSMARKAFQTNYKCYSGCGC